MIVGNDGDQHKSFFKWSWLRRHSYDPKFIDPQNILNRYE